jgi:hypothetical protein
MTIFDSDNDHICCVSDLLKFIGNNCRTTSIEPGRWMYRGHSDYNYQLIPAIGRLYQSKNFSTKEKLLDFEKSAFNEFWMKTYALTKEHNQFYILGLAQHHGLITRLLDWTFSPLVALFFAVEKEKCDKDAALITFQSQFSFNNILKNKSPFEKNESQDNWDFLFLPNLTQRISAQSGIFQLFFDPTIEFKDCYNLGKLRIKGEHKSKIKEELFNLGISYETLFPDLDGLCKSINYYKLRK